MKAQHRPGHGEFRALAISHCMQSRAAPKASKQRGERRHPEQHYVTSWQPRSNKAEKAKNALSCARTHVANGLLADGEAHKCLHICQRQPNMGFPSLPGHVRCAPKSWVHHARVWIWARMKDARAVSDLLSVMLVTLDVNGGASS